MKKVKLLTKAAQGKIRSYPEPLAENLIKHGLAEYCDDVDEKVEEKPKKK
jgi:hypothetical protein